MSSTTSPAPAAEFSTYPAAPGRRRTYSTRELQAAAAALASGQFARGEGATVPAAAPAAASREPEGAAPTEAPARTAPMAERVPGAAVVAVLGPVLGPLVRVRAANAGAGASTITLALADAADGAGIRTRVLDAAAPTWSGLVGASVTELGAEAGWRRGRRREGVLIDRVEGHVGVPRSVPAPREVTGIDLTVLDTGWTARELTATTGDGRGCWVASEPAQVEVVVARANTLALGQAEAMLASLEETRVVVVVVGAGRWSGQEFAAAGPRLCALHEDQYVVFAPLLPVKALPGLGPEPLPKQLMNPARRLLDRITTITGPLGADPA